MSRTFKLVAHLWILLNTYMFLQRAAMLALQALY